MIAIIVLALFVVMGVIAARQRRPRGPDGPDGLSLRALKALALVSSPSQRDWILAMVAEHGSLPEDRNRRQFARGCLWAVVVPRRPSDPTGVVARTVLVISALAAVGLATYGLASYQDVTAGWVWAVYLFVFLVLVAGYFGVGVWVGGLGSPLARGVGLLSAVPAVAGAWWAASSNAPVSIAAVLVVIVPPVVATLYVARKSGRPDDALVAAACASLAAGFFTFITYVATIYVTNGGPATPTLLREFAASGARNYSSWAISDDLAGAVFLLLFVPLLAMAFGTVGAYTAAPKGRPV